MEGTMEMENRDQKSYEERIARIWRLILGSEEKRGCRDASEVTNLGNRMMVLLLGTGKPRKQK